MDAEDNASRKNAQSSSAEVPLEQGILGRQRLPAKRCAHGATVLGGFPRISVHRGTIFHQSLELRHALKNLDPGVGGHASVG